MKFWNNPKIVSATPIITVIIFALANFYQVFRMFKEHSAQGQSIVGWSLVAGSILLWFNFYRVVIPEQKAAKWTTVVSFGITVFVLLSAVYWRWFGG